jgi:hypothetical protein
VIDELLEQAFIYFWHSCWTFFKTFYFVPILLILSGEFCQGNNGRRECSVFIMSSREIRPEVGSVGKPTRHQGSSSHKV